jgi:hypothetical protein
MSTLNDQNIEAWMFDYTEGNLSPEDQKTLINFIEQHPYYKEDLNLWSMSFIKAPMPDFDVAKLELGKRPSLKYFNGKGIFIVIFLLVAATAWYLLLKASKQEVVPAKTTFIKTKPVPKIEVKPPSADTDDVNIVVARKTAHKKTVKKVMSSADANMPPENVLKDTILATDQMAVDTIPVQVLSGSVARTPDTTAVIPEKSIYREVKRKVLTPQELRQIERAKTKALNKRKEELLRKGNKPYVVPFSNGF